MPTTVYSPFHFTNREGSWHDYTFFLSPAERRNVRAFYRRARRVYRCNVDRARSATEAMLHRIDEIHAETFGSR